MVTLPGWSSTQHPSASNCSLCCWMKSMRGHGLGRPQQLLRHPGASARCFRLSTRSRICLVRSRSVTKGMLSCEGFGSPSSSWATCCCCCRCCRLHRLAASGLGATTEARAPKRAPPPYLTLPLPHPPFTTAFPAPPSLQNGVPRRADP